MWKKFDATHRLRLPRLGDHKYQKYNYWLVRAVPVRRKRGKVYYNAYLAPKNAKRTGLEMVENVPETYLLPLRIVDN